LSAWHKARALLRFAKAQSVRQETDAGGFLLQDFEQNPAWPLWETGSDGRLKPCVGSPETKTPGFAKPTNSDRPTL